MGMDIWVVSNLNQLFIRTSYTKINFSRNKVVSDKAPFFVIGKSCTPHSICYNIEFAWLDFCIKINFFM